jgi:hypothetical protein
MFQVLHRPVEITFGIDRPAGGEEIGQRKILADPLPSRLCWVTGGEFLDPLTLLPFSKGRSASSRDLCLSLRSPM